MKAINGIVAALLPILAAQSVYAQDTVRLITLDPGHFHAALVQKFTLPGVDPVVHVYAPAGPDVDQHLARIEDFNKRAENPTHWQEEVYRGPDFLEKLLQEKKGNVVVISGNNALKAKYILSCIEAGLNVLADKPMAITPDDFKLIEKAMSEAKRQNLLLWDIMTERFEITTILQRELSRHREVFGELEPGTPEDPSIILANVHYFFKMVNGKPLIRPAWFYDTTQQGEAIVDVTTHLVDLTQWESFPEQVLAPEEAKVLSAKRWTTPIQLEQFKRSTQLAEYPDYLKKSVDKDTLNVYCNGSFVYTLRGIHARISAEWRFEPPTGGGDEHFSLLRGTTSALIIRQGKEQNYKPMLYVQKRGKLSDEEFDRVLHAAVADIDKAWPGVETTKTADGWSIDIPEKYRVGHEAHFAQVTKSYLKCLEAKKLPDWEVPGMLTKYSTIMQAYEKSR